MTPGWVAFVAIAVGTAAVIAFYSGYLFGLHYGFIRGWRAGRVLRAVRAEPTGVTVAESSR